MIPVDFNTLAHQCAPNVHPTTLQAIVRTESGFNPFAIGVVGGRLARQPRNQAEAVATAKALDAQGLNFSMGLGQVNKANLARYGLTYESAFDLCANLKAGGSILHECYTRAASQLGAESALGAAISCYYSGNFTRGFKADQGGTSYVQRVSSNATQANPAIAAVPAIPVILDKGAAKKAVAPRSRNPTPLTGTEREASGSESAGPKSAGWDAFGDFQK
ncbi:lytic transglycosylase domain-containing protein [Paraburkholderia susongensis]|nr:lytic transglycosylase domain-containing protein [Paraburkholderia susongensis]